MSEYLDVISWKKTAQGKNFAVRVGSAKKLDNGNIAVYLDALPIPGPDGCQLTIAPKRDAGGSQARTVRADELSDPIPF
jgi:hypothetical protein